MCFIKLMFVGFLVFVFGIGNNNLLAQESHDKKFDIFIDTLIIVNGKTIDTERISMNRLELAEADTFRINQKGISMVGFTMTGFALGKSFEIESNEPILTKAMKETVLNKQTNYKFVSIKNIILQTKDGRVVDPSLKTIKIIFNN